MSTNVGDKLEIASEKERFTALIGAKELKT